MRKLVIVVAFLSAAIGAPLDPVRAQEISQTRSLSAARLAATRAEGLKDWEAASDHAARALALAPEVEPVVKQAFQLEAVLGHTGRATELARRVAAIDRSDAKARFWLAAAAFTAGDFAGAQAELDAASSIGGDRIAGILARAWIKFAGGDREGALRSLDTEQVVAQEKYQFHFHRAMMADLLGKREEARRDHEAAFADEPSLPILALAFAQHLAHTGERGRAADVIGRHVAKEKEITSYRRPMVLALQKRLQGDGPIPLFTETAAHGLALVFLLRSWGEPLRAQAVIGLRMSLLASPNDALLLHALAEEMTVAGRHDLAIELYDRIPTGEAFSADDVFRLKIEALGRLDRIADLKVLLNRRAAENAHETWPLEALARVLRQSRRYSEAIEAYTSAIARVPSPRPEQAALWYGRGYAYERLGRWPEAEADLRRALALAPNDAMLHNFLGYSLLEHRRDVSGALPLIEKAVRLQPDSGAIVDSLGWAHYLRGDYAQAVRHLLRAVELDGSDPTIADHAGDALWRVGRRREAVALWRQALTSDPAPELAGKIRTKLYEGLDPSPQAAARPSPPAAGSAGPARLSADTRAAFEEIEKHYREYVQSRPAGDNRLDALLKSRGSSLEQLCNLERQKERGLDSARKSADDTVRKRFTEPAYGPNNAKAHADTAVIIGIACLKNSFVLSREFSAAVWLDVVNNNQPAKHDFRFLLYYAALVHALGRGVKPDLDAARRWIERYKSSGLDDGERDLISDMEQLLYLDELTAEMSRR
jgi:tetratricopeptide (TPR) repeat protein